MFFDVYCFLDSPVHSVAFSVDHVGSVPVYDMIDRDGVPSGCQLILPRANVVAVLIMT